MKTKLTKEEVIVIILGIVALFGPSFMLWFYMTFLI